MNVKDKYACVRLHDNLRLPWTIENNNFFCCMRFVKLFPVVNGKVADVDEKKLTCFTGNAFIIMTINNLNTAKCLFDKQKFKYVLPSVISQHSSENFFGKRNNALVPTFIFMSMTS